MHMYRLCVDTCQFSPCSNAAKGHHNRNLRTNFFKDSGHYLKLLLAALFCEALLLYSKLYKVDILENHQYILQCILPCRNYKESVRMLYCTKVLTFFTYVKIPICIFLYIVYLLIVLLYLY